MGFIDRKRAHMAAIEFGGSASCPQCGYSIRGKQVRKGMKCPNCGYQPMNVKY